MAKKKILIVGAQGMLGRALVEVFKNESVFALDRDEMDITKKEEVIKKAREIRPDVLINSVAYNAVDKAEEEWKLANAINGYAAGYLAQAAKSLRIPFVHYSTDYVFDGKKPEGYREDDAPNPQGHYAQSKYLGETEVKNNTDEYYLIRLSKLFGPAGISSAAKQSFVDVMLERAKSSQTIKVVDEEVSSPTYSHDLALLTRKLLFDKYPYGVYHGANSGSCTWYGFAKEIFSIIKQDIEILPVPASEFPRPAYRPPYSILLNTKLPLQRDWREALEEYLSFFICEKKEKKEWNEADSIFYEV